MKTISVVLIVVAIAAVASAGYVLANANGYLISSPSQGTSVQATPSVASTGQPSQVKLSDTSYWNSAYLISGDALDPSAQQAISGFQLEKTTLPDGSLNITLKALQPQYSDQSYIVKSGEKLYFIETAFGDDRPPSGEAMLSDDAAVLVDANGYIVNA